MISACVVPTMKHGRVMVWGCFAGDTLPRRPASRSHLFTVDIETGVLRVLFNEAAS